MPIKKKEKKSSVPVDAFANPTGTYTQTYQRPQPYQPIQQPTSQPSAFAVAGIPASSTRDLLYFFNLAKSLYEDDSFAVPAATTYRAVDALPSYDGLQATSPTSPSPVSALPVGGGNSPSAQIDPSAILVLALFRQTPTHIRPVTERFHLGPADRQPLYSLTAQPSIRCATEPNELVVKRRDPIRGTWFPVCTSDIEPSLDLVKPGNWRVASLTMEAVPVWRKVVSGQMVKEKAVDNPDGSLGRGNKLRLWWGDRATLGPIGDAYGLWWESGGDHGLLEVFYIVEGWAGFDKSTQGVVRVSLPDLSSTWLVSGGTVEARLVLPFPKSRCCYRYFHSGIVAMDHTHFAPIRDSSRKSYANMKTTGKTRL
jgi:hypothetical protein